MARTRAARPDTEEHDQELTPPDLEDVASDFLKQGRRYAIPALIAVVVLIVAGLLYARVQESTDAAIAEAQGELDKAFRVDIPRFGADEEIAEARAKRRTRLKAVIDDYPGSNAAVTAQFHLAALSYAEEDYEAARKAYAEFSQQHPAVPMMSNLARMGEANCLVALGEYEKAFEKFEALTSPAVVEDVPYIRLLAKYRAALCALVLDRPEEAKKLLNDILVAPGAEQLQDAASKLLAKLEILPAEELQLVAREAAAQPSEELTPSPAEESATPDGEAVPVEMQPEEEPEPEAAEATETVEEAPQPVERAEPVPVEDGPENGGE